MEIRRIHDGEGAAVCELWDRQGREFACADAHDDHRFWAELGFETDMVCMSLYSD